MRAGDVVYFKTGYGVVKDVIIRVSKDMAYSGQYAYRNGMVQGTIYVIDLSLKEEYERQEALDFITSYIKKCSTENLKRIARIING